MEGPFDLVAWLIADALLKKCHATDYRSGEGYEKFAGQDQHANHYCVTDYTQKTM